MAIYLYKHIQGSENIHYELVDGIALAGYNIIYNQWRKKGEPRNEGWQIDFNDLVSELQDKVSPGYRPAILIDYDPSGKEEAVLLQVNDLYAYTYACKDTGKVWGTPIMLHMQKVFGRSLPEGSNAEQRKDLISRFDAEYQEEVIEFLYLQGEDRGWNWGMVGRVNAALIPPDARKFFRQYF